VVNGNTVTPTVMMALHSLSKLPQHKINAIWFWLSFAAFFACIYLFYWYYLRYKTTSSYFLVILAIAMVAVVGFRMHLLSGQMYIFYTLLALLVLHNWMQNKFVLAGILAGFLVACRFPYAILFLPIFCTNMQFTKSALVTLVSAIAATLVLYHSNIWGEFFSAMHLHSLENAGAIPMLDKAVHITIPKEIEGVSTTVSAELSQYVQFLNADLFSVQKLLVDNGLASTTTVLILLLAIASVCTMLFVGTKKLLQIHDIRQPMLFCAFIMFVSDYFLPAPRFNYNFVQWLIPLFVMQILQCRVEKWAMALLALGICLNIYKLFWIPDCYSVGELLGLIAIVIIMKQNKFLNEK
jgi:hypothetical protein